MANVFLDGAIGGNDVTYRVRYDDATGVVNRIEGQNNLTVNYEILVVRDEFLPTETRETFTLLPGPFGPVNVPASRNYVIRPKGATGPPANTAIYPQLEAR